VACRPSAPQLYQPCSAGSDYGGSAHRWGTAIYVASSDSYESQVWFSGSTEEAFDFVGDIHIGTITP